MNTQPDGSKERETGSPVEEQKPLGAFILDFAATIAKWKKFFVRFVAAVTICATVVAILSPKWYKATARVFPAEQADLFAGMEGVSSLVKSFSGGSTLAALGRGKEIDRYLAILKSENALMKVIDKFNLTDVYEIKAYPREKTMKELLANVELIEGDEGTLEVAVFDKDPERAAAMANYFLDVLNDINSQLHVQNARGTREFVEQRYQKNLYDIRKAEDSLKWFQVRNGVMAMPEQTEATIKVNAELYGKLAAKEIELAVLKRQYSGSHPAIAEMEIEIDETRKTLREINAGANLLPEDVKALVPLKQAPQLNLQYIRFFREVEIQYKILQFVTPLYEQAKVEERRSTPSVVVLDRASVPERKAKPKIALYFLLSMLTSTLLALFVIFAVEGAHRIRAVDPNRWDSIRKTVRSDWFGLRWKKSKRD